MRKIKRALTGILAATMVMASVFTVNAGSGSGGSGAGDDGGSVESVESAEVAAITKSAGATISVAGSSVKTTIAGGYAAKNVEGVAIITPLADVKASLGLKSGQTPYIIVYDLNPQKSYKAMDSINAAAEALGASVVTSLNVDLGARQDGKFVSLSGGSIGMVAGIPKASIDPTKTYSVVKVQLGGAVTVLDDLDTNPNTVTFEVAAGPAAYSIVAK